MNFEVGTPPASNMAEEASGIRRSTFLLGGSMKRFSLLRLGILASAMACLAPFASKADDYDKKTIIKINVATEVPGITLQPGTYVLKLLNSQSNRHIVEVMNERMDHLYALTFAVAAERLEPSGKTTLTFYEAAGDRPIALRKWFWPGDTIGQEFIYPKAQAARISALTKQKVTEGNLPTLAESGQSLEPDNLKALETTSSTVESSAARESTRETEISVTAAAAEPAKSPEPAVSVIAQNVPPPPPAQREEVRAPEPAPPAIPNPPHESASVDTSGKTLPQTASNLPLIGMIGGISLALAALISVMRRRGSVSNL